MAVPTTQAILVVDIEQFGRRTDPVQAALRTAMYDVVGNAFAKARLNWSDVHDQDRGDGIIMLVGPDTSPVVLAGEVIPAIDEGLREKAKSLTGTHRMRLRVALHQGLCLTDRNGWVGEAINTAARLVDAQPLRDVLTAAARSAMALIVSDEIYRSVIRHEYGSIDAASFARITLDVKELHGQPAWIQVPGYPYPPGLPDAGATGGRGGPGPGPGPAAAERPVPAAGQSGGIANNAGTVTVYGDQIARDKHVDRGRR